MTYNKKLEVNMVYDKSVEVNVGDYVNVVTEDGLMGGEVRECKPNSLVVYIEELGDTREIEIKHVKL